MKPTEREFQGPLAPQLRSFAVRMERSGGSHAALFLILQRLDRFLTSHYPDTSYLSREIVREWFTSFAHLRPTSQSRYRTATFQFCKYLAREDPLTARYEDFSPVRLDRSFRPYIFSHEQVVHLLEETRRQPAYPSPLRPWTLELIIALLYSSGLRIGEVVRLDLSDYDRSQGTLLIRQTKFQKTRLVPLSGSCCRLIDAYLERRTDLGFDGSPATPLVWPLTGSLPRRACLASIQEAITRLMRQTNLKPPRGRIGPRIHDFRHTFAATRVLKWYREGVDVQARLPHLATYLGHRGVESTQRYLTVIPGVLEEVSPRFARFAFANAIDDERQADHAPR